MNNDLINKLTMLDLEKKCLKRELDVSWYDRKKRQRSFDRMEEINKEIKYIKFKLELERKKRNDISNRSG